MLILKTFESDEQKKLLFFCFFLVVEEGLREPFHARDWLETYGQGPCGTLTIALSPCGRWRFAPRLGRFAPVAWYDEIDKID